MINLTSPVITSFLWTTSSSSFCLLLRISPKDRLYSLSFLSKFWNSLSSLLSKLVASCHLIFSSLSSFSFIYLSRLIAYTLFFSTRSNPNVIRLRISLIGAALRFNTCSKLWVRVCSYKSCSSSYFSRMRSVWYLVECSCRLDSINCSWGVRAGEGGDEGRDLRGDDWK